MSDYFRDRVSPVPVIKAILRDYPFSASILRELLQNSDDARATTQIFVLDKGECPALMAYNDSQFQDNDWKAIQTIHESSKNGDTSKIGKYGVGFRACYHITDQPQILSGSSFAILDPLHKSMKTGFNEFKEMEHFGRFSFFSDKFGSASLPGTIMRLPLRSSPSDLSQRTVQVEELDQMIREYITEELNISLLFLDNLKTIEIWKANGDDKALLAKWSKSEQISVRQNGDSSLFTYDSVLSNGDVQHSWRIVQTRNSEKEATSRLSTLVGGEAVNHIIQRHKLRSDVRIAYPLSSDGYTSGRLFTFLPLPSKTNFPVHIHALFALTSSRQSLLNSNETAIVSNSDNDILIKWNHLLFDYYIPQAWSCLLKTLAEDSDAACKDIFTAWPPYCSSITAGDGFYWQNILPATFKVAIQSGSSIWPKVSVNSTMTYVDLTSSLVVTRDQIDRDILVALAQLGLTLVQLPQEHMNLLDKSITKLTPRTAQEHLVLQGLVSTPFDGLSSDQRNILCTYFLSEGDFDNVYNLPLFPVLKGSYVSLNERASTTHRYVALTVDEVGVLGASAGDAIPLAQLHPNVAKLVREEGTNRANVDLLTPQTVVVYLSRETEQRSDEHLAKLWLWLSTWRDRDETMRLFKESSALPLVPTSKGPQTVSSHVFRPSHGDGLSWGRPLFEKLGFAFISSTLSPSAVQFLSNHGVLKNTRNVGHFMDAIDADVLPPLTDEESKRVFDHVAGHFKSLTPENLTKLKKLPIFPILNPRVEASGLCNASVRWGSIDGLVIKGVSPIRLVPVQPQTTSTTCYLYESSISDPSCSLLKAALHIPVLTDINILLSALDLFSTQPKSIQASFVCYIRQHHKSTNNVRSTLQAAKFVLSSASTLEAPQDMIDPKSSLGDVFTPDSAGRHVPKIEDDHNRDIIEGLRDLGMLAVALTPVMVQERISYISSNHESPQASSIARALLSLMNAPGFLCSGLLFGATMRWLPTRIGLVSSEECINTGRQDTDLFDEVLTPLDASISISSSFKALLGWDKSLPLDVLTKQLDRVLDRSEDEVRYRKVCSIIRELARRSLSDADIQAIRQVVSQRPWIPTKSARLAPHSRAVFASVPDSSCFYEIGFFKAADHQVYQFLTRMGCPERPTSSAIIAELNSLRDSAQIGHARIQQAVQLLEMLPDSMTDRERKSLLVPTVMGDLVTLGTGVYYYKGTVSRDDESIPIAHHLVSEELALKLKMQRLGLEEAEDEIDLGEKPITTIRNTLRQYDPIQFFTEFIANASDAKARRFSVLVDDHEGPTQKLLSERLAAFQGPALVVFNDATFSQDDFRGILQTGLGAKSGKRGMIGRFGLGALTMFHFTELAMIVSGDQVLLMSPSERNLSFSGKHSVLLPLRSMKKLYADHLEPLHGLHDFDLESTEPYNGTLFRLPLRKHSHSSYDSVSSRTWDANEMEKLLLEQFDGLAYKSLLFTELGQIDVQRRRLDVKTVRHIECTRSPDGPVVDTIGFETVTFQSDHVRSASWLISSMAVNIPREFSKQLAEKYNMHHLLPVRIAVALDRPQVKKIEYNLFCSLPLPIAMRLPAHISAPLILEQERRNVRIDKLGVESEYNQWLFSSEIPRLYLCLLERLLQTQQMNDPWWPGVQTLSVDINAPSQTIIEAFWKPETLKGSPRRVFASKYEPATCLSPRDSVLFSKERFLLVACSNALSKLLSKTNPSNVVELPRALLEVAEKAKLRFVDGIYVKKLLEGIGEPRCFDAKEIKALLSFMLRDKVSVNGLSLLPLKDGSYAKLGSQQTKALYVVGPGSDHEVAYTLFPPDRLVHRDFDVPKELLVSADQKRVSNVLSLDKAGIIELVKECVDPADELLGDEAHKAWVTTFWNSRLDVDAEKISQLPLIPTLRPLHFISLDRVRTSSVVVVEQDKSAENFNYDILHKLNMTVVVRGHLSAVAAQLVRRKKPTPYESFLGHIETNQSEYLEAIKRLSPGDREELGCWVRLKFSSTPNNSIGIACKLPVWPVQRPFGKIRLVALNDATILPNSMPSVVLRPFTDSDIIDLVDGMQRINKKPCTPKHIANLLRNSPGGFPLVPGTLLRPSRQTEYRRFIECFLSFGKVDGYSLLVPNERWVLTEVEELFEQDDLFKAAFQGTPERLLSRHYQDLAGNLERHGLSRKHRLDLAMFIECAKAFSQDVDEIKDDDNKVSNKRDRSITLYQHFNSLSLQHWRDSSQCHALDHLNFIPRDVSERPGYGGIEVAKYMRGSILSPSRISLPQYEAICWSQRGRINPEPNPTLCGTYQNLGKPTGREVVKHLKVLAEIGRKHDRHTALLSDLKATYKWLNEHASEIEVEMRNENSNNIFLNVNNPYLDKWEWHSANVLLKGIQDVGELRDVKGFLLDYSNLLDAAGVRTERRPDPYMHVIGDKTMDFRRQFNDMRKRGYDVNVTFRARDDQNDILPAHRTWLNLHSNHFWDSFVTGGFQESRPLGDGEYIKITVEDFSSLCVKEVVDWMYVGKLPESITGQSKTDEDLTTKQELALDMLSLSNYWNVTELHMQLQELIINTRGFISAYSVNAIREHARDTCAKPLLDACNQYMVNNSEIIAEVAQD